MLAQGRDHAPHVPAVLLTMPMARSGTEFGFVLIDQYFNMQDHPVFVDGGDDGSGSHQVKPGRIARGSTDPTLPRVWDSRSGTGSVVHRVSDDLLPPR